MDQTQEKRAHDELSSSCVICLLIAQRHQTNGEAVESEQSPHKDFTSSQVQLTVTLGSRLYCVLAVLICSSSLFSASFTGILSWAPATEQWCSVQQNLHPKRSVRSLTIRRSRVATWCKAYAACLTFTLAPTLRADGITAAQSTRYEMIDHGVEVIAALRAQHR